MTLMISVLVLGIGATLVMDLWGLVRRALFGVPTPDYRLVGRWLAHMRHGQFVHRPIAASAPVAGESLLGWAFHYTVGIAFAALLVGLEGRAWMAQPTLLPALAVGLATVVAPLLLLQPGMGTGIAASKVPRPWHARFHSVVTHLVFGAGLYLSALMLASGAE